MKSLSSRFKEPDRKPEDSSSKPAPPVERSLRDELLPASENLMDEQQRGKLAFLTPTKVISTFIAMILLALGWFIFFGPGAPALEKFLDKLAMQKEAAPTQAPTITNAPVSDTPTATGLSVSLPTLTASPMGKSTSSPTVMPTNTLVPTSSEPPATPTETATATPETPTAAPLPTSLIEGCTPASAVTIDDVGKTMCVVGKVLRTKEKNGIFYIYLEQDPKAFFFVSYQRSWDLKAGECVFATGPITNIVSIPIMEIGYNPPLEFCPIP
jgi:hypothetical protein